MSDLGTLVQSGATQPIDTSNRSWSGGLWFEQLLPGKWRNVGFFLDSAQTSAGRRIALHEYPYRDTVWPEDLGKLPRRFAFNAFLTGDDVYQQRNAMIAACEQPGPGTLVHPTLGTMQCVLLDFSVSDRRERGRYVEISFAFVAWSEITFPTSVTATGDNVRDAASAADAASASDLSRLINVAGTSIPSIATAIVPGYANLAIAAVNDPTRALNAVAGLQGLFGRYSAGRRSTLLPVTATVASALADSVTTRQAVLDAATALTAAAAAL